VDAIEFLHNDHEQVLGMFSRLEQDARPVTAGDADRRRRRQELVTELVIAESQHEAVEEQYFWPAVREQVPGGDQLADHAVEQEQAAKHILARLDGMSADEPEFEKLVAQVIEDGREHIAYEQDMVWPRLRETLTPQEMIKLGEQMAAAKKAAPTRPHPHTPPSPGALKTVGAAAAMVDKARDAMTGRGKPDSG
jgi:hemerythrin HHE cation binding domain-containing protein